MEEKLYQEMIFSIKQYKWQNSDEEARDLMWQDIAKFLQLLTKNQYIAVVYDDDNDVIIIQYEHNEINEYWGDPNPRWLTDEEYDKIANERENLGSQSAN